MLIIERELDKLRLEIYSLLETCDALGNADSKVPLVITNRIREIITSLMLINSIMSVLNERNGKING